MYASSALRCLIRYTGSCWQMLPSSANYICRYRYRIQIRVRDTDTDTDTDTDVCTYTNSDHRIMIRLLVLLEVIKRWCVQLQIQILIHKEIQIQMRLLIQMLLLLISDIGLHAGDFQEAMRL